MMIHTGNCVKCGAPYFQEHIWHGITPPPIKPTCICWNLPRYREATSNDIENISKSEQFREMVKK